MALTIILVAVNGSDRCHPATLLREAFGLPRSVLGYHAGRTSIAYDNTMMEVSMIYHYSNARTAKSINAQ